MGKAKLSNEKIRAQLRERKVYNSWGFAAGAPFISRFPGDERKFPRYTVTRAGENLGLAWYDNGSRVFIIRSRAADKATFEQARAWASAKWHLPAEWIKEPFGSWVPAEVYYRRLRELGVEVAKPSPRPTKEAR